MAEDNIALADPTATLGTEARRCDACDGISVATFMRDGAATSFCAVHLGLFRPDAASIYALIAEAREIARRLQQCLRDASAARSTIAGTRNPVPGLRRGRRAGRRPL